MLDRDVRREDVQELSSRDRVAAFFATLGYNTDARLPQTPPNHQLVLVEDPRDQLRGHGLRAIWPGHISAEELFSCLHRRRDDYFVGSYWIFLRHPDFTSPLQAEHLPVALRWIVDQKITLYPTDDLRECAHTIVLRAYDQSHREDVRCALAAVFWDRLRQHDTDIAFGNRDKVQTFKAKLQRDTATRRTMLTQMVVSANPDDRIADLVWCHPPLVYPEDFEWVVQRLLESTSPESERWVDLAKYIFDPRVLAHVEATHFAMGHSLLARDALGCWFKPVELGSPEALEMKARHEEREKWQRPHEPKLLDPLPHQRVKQVIDQCLGGRPELWWHLAREMTLEPTSENYNYGLFLNPAGSPAWREGNSATRAEILEITRRFVQQVTPDETWIGTNSIPVSELGGFAAFRLLLEADPTFLDTLDDSVWRRWAPSILAYSVIGEEDDRAAHWRLIGIAYQHAPDEMLTTLDRLITGENEKHGHAFILHEIQGCWDSRLSEAVLGRAGKLDVKPASFGDLLKPLLERRDSGAAALAVSLLTIPPPTAEPDRERSIEAAVQLLAHDANAGWTAFWTAADSDLKWARKVFERLCQEMSGDSLVRQLDEAQIGRLLDWLLVHYPHDSDPKRSSGFAAMGDDDMVRQWRDGLIYGLRDWGTVAAVAEIQRLKAAHPELAWLQWTSLLASRMRQKYAWRPATPRQIIGMAQDRNRRFATTGSQLLDILRESLQRLQEKLRGETPRARLLWDTIARRPKEEEDLSDYVKNHLEDDLAAKGIVVGREVKIRRRNWNEGAPGQLTDIHVDAVSTDPHHGSADQIRAIIEVKGCWHREVKTAMETQLLQRYLARNQCQHGLYVVGWFLCDNWTDEDDRKAETARLFGSFEECRAHLDSQAENLSVSLAPSGGGIRAVVLDYRLP